MSVKYNFTCQFCDAAFTAGRKDARFCSKECYNKSYYQADIETQDHARYVANREKIIAQTKARSESERRKLFTEFFEKQDGKCYLCEKPLPEDKRQIHVDHDHRCCPPGKHCESCRRGLACYNCNSLIGHAKDDPDCLHRVADNLAKANKRVTTLLNDKQKQ